MESCRMWGELESEPVESTYTINFQALVGDEPFEAARSTRRWAAINRRLHSPTFVCSFTMYSWWTTVV